MESNAIFWSAIKQGKELLEMEKNMITEKQGEGQFDIDTDLDHLRKKLESARLGGNEDEINRLEGQISLLEDSVIVYRVNSASERRVFKVDLGDLPPTKASDALDGIRSEIEKKQLNG